MSSFDGDPVEVGKLESNFESRVTIFPPEFIQEQLKLSNIITIPDGSKVSARYKTELGEEIIFDAELTDAIYGKYHSTESGDDTSTVTLLLESEARRQLFADNPGQTDTPEFLEKRKEVERRQILEFFEHIKTHSEDTNLLDLKKSVKNGYTPPIYVNITVEGEL